MPLPWSGDAPPFGFSPAGAAAPPWLPQPASWRELTAEVQKGDPGSMLELYREALRIRHGEPTLGDGGLVWLPAPAEVLALRRDPGFGCVVNLSRVDVPLPRHEGILLASGPVVGDLLPADTAVWLRLPA